MKGNLEKPRKKGRTRRSLNSIINSKIFFLLFSLAFFFIIITLKLIHVNIVRGDELTRSALNQLTKTEIVNADRGIIYDRNKKELAVNVTKANVFYNMSFRKGTTEERKAATIEGDIEKLAPILETEPEKLKELLVGDKVVRIASNISREKALEIKELKLRQVSVDDVVRRFYPYGTMASQVIGFINDEGNGQYGVEAKYDSELSGIPGKNVSIKSNTQAKIPLTQEENYAPKDGLFPVLTLDETIQQFAEDAVILAKEETKAQKVSILVQDTKTGAILAMANTDNYNLNDPKAPIGIEQQEKWDELTREEKTEYWFKNWKNSNISSQFEPGSTFKLVTAAASLEEATTFPTKEYFCPGAIELAKGVKVSCTSKVSGTKTMEQAIIESCNVTLIKMARELGKDNMLKYIKAFGFGEKTGVDLPAEIGGTIPNSVQDISGVRLATLSYGHGIAVTPLQLINAVSAIGNGGYLNTPRIVDRIEDKNGNVIEKNKEQSKRRVISESTSQTMRKIMKRVVEEGTGKKAKVPGYAIGGKTGTANIASKKGYEDAYISSFVGMAPIDDPQVTILVIVERPSGNYYAAETAAPVAQLMFRNTLEYLKVPKTEPIEDKNNKELVEVPDVKNLLVSDAGKKIVNANLTFSSNSKNLTGVTTVIRQTPQPGTMVKPETTIELFVNDNDTAKLDMPYLIGKEENKVKNILKTMGLEYNIQGTGEVKSQSIKPGAKIDRGDKITITMTVGNTDSSEKNKNENVKNNESKNKNKKNNKTEKNLKNKNNSKVSEDSKED